MLRKQNINRSLFFIIFLLTACSCDKELELEDKIKGQWEIREITYNGVNYKEELYINFMMFEDNDKLSIPASRFFEKDPLASWKTFQIEDKFKLIIQSEDEVFKGDYNLVFIKNLEEKLLGIQLNSDSTHIKAYKLFQDFESKQEQWQN